MVPLRGSVDPDRITVFELIRQSYREATSGTSIAVEQPFPVEVELA